MLAAAATTPPLEPPPLTTSSSSESVSSGADDPPEPSALTSPLSRMRLTLPDVEHPAPTPKVRTPKRMCRPTSPPFLSPDSDADDDHADTPPASFFHAHGTHPSRPPAPTPRAEMPASRTPATLARVEPPSRRKYAVSTSAPTQPSPMAAFLAPLAAEKEPWFGDRRFPLRESTPRPSPGSAAPRSEDPASPPRADPLSAEDRPVASSSRRTLDVPRIKQAFSLPRPRPDVDSVSHASVLFDSSCPPPSRLVDPCPRERTRLDDMADRSSTDWRTLPGLSHLRSAASRRTASVTAPTPVPTPPAQPPRVLTPPPGPRAGPHTRFLCHAPPPPEAGIAVEALAGRYRLRVRLPGTPPGGVTLSARTRQRLHIAADGWEAGGGHFERRVQFGPDADLTRVSAAFESGVLDVSIPRREDEGTVAVGWVA